MTFWPLYRLNYSGLLYEMRQAVRQRDASRRTSDDPSVIDRSETLWMAGGRPGFA
jgi:hypothetical protein